MMKHELELAQLKIGINHIPGVITFGKEDHSTDVCSSSMNNLPLDLLIFSVGVASSTTLPFLPS
jgi:hypothetical protein